MSGRPYAAEIRFGVVMYGGVSLAIYINGVSNELFEMACATPRAGFDLAAPANGDPEPCTREIYRRLSWLVGSVELRRAYAKAITERLSADPWPAGLLDAANTAFTGILPTRLVVDVIAGTSAGGINGIFLAKALANGEQFGRLKKLWVEEGDFSLLLNDRLSYDTKPKLSDRSAEPGSLLNSDRMYFKLREAMGAMETLAWRGAQPLRSPLAEQVDLFVTTTDIKGSVVPLRLFDKVVYELRFKQSYHFSYPYGASGATDFSIENLPFLAFAARCTSSFPFAFEPMTLGALERLAPVMQRADLARWNAFFPNLPHQEVSAGRHLWRAFGDGGYLDNKPFSYVVEALAQRFSSVPLERKLVYVEPSPDQLQVPADDAPAVAPVPFGTPPDPSGVPAPPDALSNALAALSSIPRYESIREDLQAVLQRNRRIERIERLVRLGERDLGLAGFDPLSRLPAGTPMPDWQRLKLSEIVHYYGLAYVPHVRLRLNAVTDDLAERLGQLWAIDGDADFQYALRALVRLWRERNFDDEGTAPTLPPGRDTNSSFLDQFDVEYRMRRLAYLMRKTDQLIRLLRKRCVRSLTARTVAGQAVAPLSEVERQLLLQMPKLFSKLARRLPRATLEAGVAALETLKAQMADLRLALLQQRQADRLAVAAAGAPRRTILRAAMVATLKLLLGQTLLPNDITALGKYATPFMDKMRAPQALGVASLSRTLQESVLLRARLLFGKGGPVLGNRIMSPLQAAFECDLERLRFKNPSPIGATPPPAVTPLAALGARLDALLGTPRFDAADTGRRRLVVDWLPQNVVAEPAPYTRAGHDMRLFLGRLYRRFDLFDQMSFGLYYDTGTGEPSTVEVVRISPQDATSLVDEAGPGGRPKLAGTVLGNFGAFLDSSWRVNDIMWGRLDGAERLIQALLPMADEDSATIRAELIGLAHDGILAETLVPQGTTELTGVLVQALRQLVVGKQSSRDSEQKKAKDEALRQLIGSLSATDAKRRRIGTLLSALFDAPQLRRYVAEHSLVAREPDPKATLRSVARAVSITGRVLQGISTRRHVSPVASRWLARIGLLLQGLVAVSLPDSLAQRWWSHGFKVLYAFEIIAVLAALLFGSGGTRSLALTTLGVTIGVHLASLVIRDYVRDEDYWIRLLVGVVIVVVVLVALLGALILAYQGVQQEMCWRLPGLSGADGVASWLCWQLSHFHAWLTP